MKLEDLCSHISSFLSEFENDEVPHVDVFLTMSFGDKENEVQLFDLGEISTSWINLESGLTMMVIDVGEEHTGNLKNVSSD